MSKLDLNALRTAFGSFMTGVTIVTAQAEDGTLVGFTANSFTSVSMDPPLLLVCPGNHLSSIDIFRNCKHFAVNVLAETQQELSNLFASSKLDRFAKTDWYTDNNGAPIISGALASFSCSTHQIVTAGDHLVLIGEVNHFTNSEGLGLGYWRGGYFSLGKERDAQLSSSADQAIIVGSIVEEVDRIFVVQEHGKLSLPTIELTDEAQARAGVKDMLHKIGLPAEIGRVYSVFHDTKEHKRFIYFRALLPTTPDAAIGTFLTIEDAATKPWRQPSEGAMVQRYLLERNTNQFGLYIGDSDAGEVHHETQT